VSIAALVDDALACVAAEHADAYARMRTALAGRCIEAKVDHELVTVALESSPGPTVRVRTSVDAVCAVLLGECEIMDAVLADRLDVVGAPDDLVALADALIWFVEGAMRCVSIGRLVERLLELRKEHHGN
jgi:hypothetical protein